MTDPNLTRRLSAILSADVEAYSRLMRDDEEATVKTITAYRTAMTGFINQYRGRVVDSPGDNILAEFTSVLDAVNCGVEIQRELAERNAELPENRRMRFRIGINLGDILQEKERIYGDGVNIAARLEALAEAGGICISGTVYDSIEGKLGLEFEYLGEHEVKNIDKPIRVYRVLSFPGAAAHRVIKAKRAFGKTWRNIVLTVVAVLILSGGALAIWQFYLRPAQQPTEVPSEQVPATQADEEAPPPIPAEPSIAILPFANISGDPKEDYLSDGITEQIITALSKIPQMLVIARNSVFTYKGKPVMVQQVSKELGVRYVLEGSVQKSGDRLRVTAQLIDAKTGNHLWSDRYDRELKDLFALQDDITKNVITALQVKMTEGECARSLGRGTKNLEAYLKLMEGVRHHIRFTKNDHEIARHLYGEALSLDPDYANAYMQSAATHYEDALFGWTDTPWKSYDKAEELAKRALSIDKNNAHAYMVLAKVYCKRRQFDEAMVAAKKGLSLEPANANTNALYGDVLNHLGKYEEAIPFLKKSIRMDPKPPAWVLGVLGGSYYGTGLFNEAISVFEKAISRESNPPAWCLSRIGWSYFHTSRNEEAVAAFEKWITYDPEDAYAHAFLGVALVASGKPEEADTMLEKAMSLNLASGWFSWASCILAIARYGTGEHEKGIRMLRELFHRNPSSAFVCRSLALVLIFDGKYEEALLKAKEAVKLEKTIPSPAPDALLYAGLGLSHRMLGDYDAAIAAYAKAIDIWPEYIYGHIGLTAAYSLAGDMKAAQAKAIEVLKINPDFSLSDIAKNGYYNFQKADKERFINALRNAGLK